MVFTSYMLVLSKTRRYYHPTSPSFRVPCAFWYVFSKKHLCIFLFTHHLSFPYLSFSRSIWGGEFQKPAYSRLHVRRRPIFPMGLQVKNQDSLCACEGRHLSPQLRLRGPSPPNLPPPSLHSLSLTSCQPSRAHYPGMQFSSLLLCSSDLFFFFSNLPSS